MDSVKVEDLKRQLLGQEIRGWKVIKYVNHGKSAAVFKARRGKRLAAVKIFDDELIKRYGDATQLARIERELTLVGHRHPNMVTILDGGFDDVTASHFIIMSYVDGPNLAECLNLVPIENIPILIQQLASAAQFLESHGLCHRDIKPENIALIDGLKHLVLLDFGVIRPMGVTGLTDGDQIRAFVGTLRYSSPEFLLRQEDDSINGWRALTFYQIGGVLHDLIMRKPLFAEFSEPYAALVNAVQAQQPNIQNSVVPRYLVELAGKCLLKSWRIRLDLITWDDFLAPGEPAGIPRSAKERVTNRSILKRAQRAQDTGQRPTLPQADEILDTTLHELKTQIRSIRNENTVLPRIEISGAPPGSNRLRVCFEPSDDIGSPHALIIYLEAHILEAVSNAIRVLARSYIDDFDPEVDEIPPDRLYAGVCNGAAIREALEDYLYEVLDHLQERSADVGRLQGSFGEAA